MRSKANTIKQYLNELPNGRQAAIETVREVILRNLPTGYEEVVNWGMITYQVPLDIFPDTYNAKPLMYVGLASQKNHMSIYLIGIYIDEEIRRNFEQPYRATSKRYDVGKSCVRFRKLDDLTLELIGQSIHLFEVDEFVKRFKDISNTRRRKCFL